MNKGRQRTHPVNARVCIGSFCKLSQFRCVGRIHSAPACWSCLIVQVGFRFKQIAGVALSYRCQISFTADRPSLPNYHQCLSCTSYLLSNTPVSVLDEFPIEWRG